MFRATICDNIISKKLPVEFTVITFPIVSEPCGVIGMIKILTSFRGKPVLAKLLRGESSIGSSTVTDNEF